MSSGWLLGLELSRGPLDLDGAQSLQHGNPYRLRGPVSPAPAGNQEFHFLLDAELAQAG
jgi:hypothetical protein